MSTYSQTLKAFLDDGVTQAELGSLIGKTQVAVLRYARGDRFPDADTARAIDAATKGRVAFTAWRSEFEQRSGIAA